MIIQTRFANRNYARTLRQLAQRRYDVVPRFPDIRWMNPDDREDIRISFRDLDRAPAARDRCSDGEDAGDTSFSRASQARRQSRARNRGNRGGREFRLT